MALGGGNFTAQNKVLPGSYINFVSAKTASDMLGERGTVAVALPLSWGADDEIITVTTQTFTNNSVELFGFAADAKELMPIREILRNADKVLVYKLMSEGVSAANTLAEAKCKGERGNALKTVVRANVNAAERFDVLIYLNETLVYQQLSVATVEDLHENPFVTWKSDATLAEDAGTALTAGSNGKTLTAQEYQVFLAKLESYPFHVLVSNTESDDIKNLIVAYTKRLRDQVGVKFQSVLYQVSADYEGVVSVENSADAVYWAAGAIAGCALNRSLTNKVYNGELTVPVNFTQVQLEDALSTGKFVFHRVGDSVRVLDDINTLVTLGDKSAEFQRNQVIHVLDQIGNDIAALFNDKYLGEIPNDNSGRMSLWSDVKSYLDELADIRAIQEFDPEKIKVDMGVTKTDVVVDCEISTINAMTKLYMTVVLR